MKIEISQVQHSEIIPLRQRYLNEMDCQIRYDACHVRGWSDSYLIRKNGESIGYGSIKGRDDLTKRDAIFEFFLLPGWRHKLSAVYSALIRRASPVYLECQTNDLIHTSLLLQYGTNFKTPAILFADNHGTQLQIENAAVRKRRPEDVIFEKNNDAGKCVLVVNSEIVASGGFLLHYNVPFADLYMETRHDQRNKGYASFLLQELKKICYRNGRVPSARCRVNNYASRAALKKAGFQVCGHMVSAEIK